MKVNICLIPSRVDKIKLCHANATLLKHYKSDIQFGTSGAIPHLTLRMGNCPKLDLLKVYLRQLFPQRPYIMRRSIIADVESVAPAGSDGQYLFVNIRYCSDIRLARDFFTGTHIDQYFLEKERKEYLPHVTLGYSQAGFRNLYRERVPVDEVPNSIRFSSIALGIAGKKGVLLRTVWQRELEN